MQNTRLTFTLLIFELSCVMIGAVEAETNQALASLPELMTTLHGKKVTSV